MYDTSIGNGLQEAFDASKGLFLATSAGELYPNPAAYRHFSSPASRLRFLGAMLGKAMYEGIMIEVPLAGFFLKKVRCQLTYVQLHASLGTHVPAVQALH